MRRPLRAFQIPVPSNGARSQAIRAKAMQVALVLVRLGGSGVSGFVFLRIGLESPLGCPVAPSSCQNLLLWGFRAALYLLLKTSKLCMPCFLSHHVFDVRCPLFGTLVHARHVCLEATKTL